MNRLSTSRVRIGLAIFKLYVAAKRCIYITAVSLMQHNVHAKLRRMAACIVSFVDLDGVRHSVEVDAEGLYEASVLGLCAFRKHELEPGAITQLEVEVRSSVKHTLTVTKVHEWLRRGVRTPKEAVLKERLRTPISGGVRGGPRGSASTYCAHVVRR